jgi:hypothetical protein
MHGARFLVFLPRRTSNVTTNNGLNGQDAQFAHLHAPVLQHGTQRRGDLGREVEGEEVCAQRGNRFRQDLEPGSGAEGEENAFVRDALKLN